MQNYQQATDKLGSRESRKLANNTHLVRIDDNTIGVRLHNTYVVTYHADGRIVLGSGGWQTMTTKQRMNEYSPVRVSQTKGVWYANGQPYADGITFHDDGSIVGTGNNPAETEKQRKAVNKYAKAYANAFIAGQVPAPSNGDCWACLMASADGKAPLGGADHICSHIEEQYFVPSILTRMADAGTLSIMAKDYIARQWQGEPREPMGSLEKEQIYKTVRKFCLSELGLPA